MVTILCVDDEPDMELLITQQFRKQIRNNEYQFVFAHNGIEALAKLVQYPDIRLVLSDINMPEMDGLTFLSRIKEVKNSALRTVMVSAYGDMDNIRSAMNRGAFDFITKPINLEDLEVTIRKTLEEIEQYRVLLTEHDKLVSIQTDLQIAYEIQQAMLPKATDPFPERPEFELHGLLQPAKAVGGDLFDYLLIDQKKLFFMIGDVSDKGVPAALYMAITKILFKTHFTDNPEVVLTDEVRRINNILAKDNPSLMFVTAFACVLNIETGEVEYVDAGHEQPLIVRAETGDIEVLKKNNGGLPLCIEDGYPYQSRTVQLNPGDVLFLYTDGLEDALNPEGLRYKIDPCMKLLKESLLKETPQKINTTLLDNIKTYIGTANQFDDITMLTLRYLGKKQASLS